MIEPRFVRVLATAALALAGCVAPQDAAPPPPDETGGDPAGGDPPSVAPSELALRLEQALADNFVTATEWTNRLAPLAQQLPRIATPDGNTLARLWGDQASKLSTTAYEGLRTVLHNCGYPVARTASEPLLPGAVLIADNLTTLDLDFEAVAAAAGVAPNARITIAVLDDGIRLDHPVLAGHEVTAPGALVRWDYVENDATLPATDHGTATSSIAARGGPRVQIVPLRIAVNSGIPASLAFGQVVSAAIDDAAAAGIRVVSFSYVTNRPPDIQLIRAAMARHPDIVFVLAAGNGNSQLGTGGLAPDTFLPTMQAPNVITVANATRAGVRHVASFDGSNYGTPWVDVAMRGMDLPCAVSSIPYGRSRGTSSATPNVAAVVARMRLIDPSLTGAQVKAMLMQSILPSPAWTGLVNAGGLVDQARAIRAAAGL